MNIDRAIRKKFHVHGVNALPFTGWHNCTRKDLIEVFAEVGYRVGAEVGVRKGENALFMFKTIPDLKLYCIDPWTPYKTMPKERQDVYLQIAHEALDQYDAIFVQKTSMDAVKDFEDEFFDFVYIDGRHEFDFVMEDLIHWSPKVKKGGIVSGHDYYFFPDGGIVDAVNAYTKANNIYPWYVTRQDKEHTFCWVR